MAEGEINDGLRMVSFVKEFFNDFEGTDAATVLHQQMQAVPQITAVGPNQSWLEAATAEVQYDKQTESRIAELREKVPEEFFYLLCCSKKEFSSMSDQEKRSWRIQVQSMLEIAPTFIKDNASRLSIALTPLQKMEIPDILKRGRGNLNYTDPRSWSIQVPNLHELRALM